ncbi:MAG: GerMN domain-containing protein [Bacillota bacterium]|jgi:germination protein M
MVLKKQNEIKIALGLLLAVLVFSLTGCALIDRLQAWKQVKEELPVEDPAEPQELQISQETAGNETKEILLYFSDESGQYLVHETRSIPKVESIGRAVLQELIAGPSTQSGLLPTIPTGTELRDINVRPDGLCIVDFSEKLINNHPGGSKNEELTVYSIVNSLTQFPTIREVQILINGKQVETIAGHMDVSAAMARNDEVIKK